MTTLLAKAVNWPFYRLRLRAPRLMAWLEQELPLRHVVGLDQVAEPSGNLIPNVVYQTWLDNRFGRRHAAALRRVRAVNADFSFEFFDEAGIERFMQQHYAGHPILKIFQNARFGPMRADIWRYCILHRRGGVYLDIGKSINMPLRDLIAPGADAILSWERRGQSPYLASAAAAAVLQHPNQVMINWGMMFAPGHPLLTRVIDGIVAKYAYFKGRVSDEPKSDILRFTGPLHLTECLLASAEAGELVEALQVGIEFRGAGQWGVPGAWVRYIGQPPYELARGECIVA